MTQKKKNECFKAFAKEINDALATLRKASEELPILNAINITVAVETEKNGEESRGWDVHSFGVCSPKFNVKRDDGTTPNQDAFQAVFLGMLKDPNVAPMITSAIQYVMAERMAKAKEGKEAKVVELNKGEK